MKKPLPMVALFPILLPHVNGGAFCLTYRSLSSPRTTDPNNLRVALVDDPSENGRIRTMNAKQQQSHKPLEMPWSEFQAWALNDNLPRYLINIPTTDDDDDDDAPSQPYALWRTMIRDVPELSGYDVSFLRTMMQQQQHSKTETETPGLLPLLEEFQFETNGGITGKAYGLPGIADGTLVQTPPLKQLRNTLPKGYVQTDDGTVAYELGIPAGVKEYGSWGTKEARMRILNTLAMTTTMKAAAMQPNGMGKSGMAKVGGVNEESRLLVNLGGITAMLLAGATAVNMLHHHLTVNVFWV